MSIYDKSGYAQSEKKTHEAITYALEKARNRHLVLDHRDRPICSDFDLAAVDLMGRKKWTRALCNEFELRFDLPESATEFFWFCITDTSCLQELSSPRGAEFHIENSIKRYRPALQGLSYVAMIEPSIYVSASKIRPPALADGYKFEQVISWHCHGLAWGPSRGEMKQHFNRVEDSGDFRPIASPMKGCWAQSIKPQLVGEKLAYMNKTPRDVSRIWCTNGHQATDDTEYTFRQDSEPCTPGQHIHYFRILADTTMNQLAFAGGEGSEILRAVKKPYSDQIVDGRRRIISIRLDVEREMADLRPHQKRLPMRLPGCEKLFSS